MVTTDTECPLSRRVDGKRHTWQFDGDDPYIECCWCGEYRDALTGAVLKPGRRDAIHRVARELPE